MCTIFSGYVIAVSQLSQQGAVSYFVSNTGCISFLIAQYVIAVSFTTDN